MEKNWKMSGAPVQSDPVAETTLSARGTTGRDALVDAHLPLVDVCARRFVSAAESMDDLRQVGVIGLLKAAGRFDPARGVPFAAYAVPFVLGELRHHVRDSAWPVRVPRADGVTRAAVVAVPLEDGVAAAPDDLADADDRLVVTSLVRQLGTRQREVVYRYFVRGRSQADIGRELGMTQIQVSRMLRTSLAIMRRRLESVPR
jgi:RNA polymerase sigma-B factor